MKRALSTAELLADGAPSCGLAAPPGTRAAPAPTAKLAALIVLYYGASSLNSCLTKYVLNSFPRPVTVALVQQACSAAFAVAEHGRQTGGSIAVLAQWRAIIPVAVALLTAVVSYRTSLVYIPVSFAQAVKTLQPLFTIALSRSLLKEAVSPRRLFSLLLLIAGVGTVTATELSFSALGFGCALLSASSQALQTVLTKSVLLRAQLRRTELFAGAAVLTLLLLAPPWLLIDGLELARAEGATLTSRTMGLMLANGACSFCSQ